jgi:hypothetical protein
MADGFFQARSIDVDGLPENIKHKAQAIIEQLENGAHYGKFHGKKMFFDRKKISIPVTYSYRLLCREVGNEIVVQDLVSHEVYNKLLRRR